MCPLHTVIDSKPHRDEASCFGIIDYEPRRRQLFPSLTAQLDLHNRPSFPPFLHHSPHAEASIRPGDVHFANVINHSVCQHNFQLGEEPFAIPNHNVTDRSCPFWPFLTATSIRSSLTGNIALEKNCIDWLNRTFYGQFDTAIPSQGFYLNAKPFLVVEHSSIINNTYTFQDQPNSPQPDSVCQICLSTPSFLASRPLCRLLLPNHSVIEFQTGVPRPMAANSANPASTLFRNMTIVILASNVA